jgi:hypothetical protein
MFQLRYVLFVVTTFVLIGVTAFAVDLPHVFSAGTTIRSAQVNANFAAIASAIPLVAHGVGQQPVVAVTSTTAAEDIATVTLAVPGPGTVIVSATGSAQIGATTLANLFAYQIDTTAGGVLATGDDTVQLFGSLAPGSDAVQRGAVAIQRSYAVTAGTHTFRLEAMVIHANGTRFIGNPQIVATFYPQSQVVTAAP